MLFGFFFVCSFLIGHFNVDGHADTDFTFWKEPPIDSGNGKGNATIIVKENNKVGSGTGIKLQVVGGSGKISYVLEQPNPLPFGIGGPNMDEITTASPIDFEMLDRITVTVIAFDEGTPQKTGSAEMTIFIGDVNEFAPVFQNKLYEVKISPLVDIGEPFAMIRAADNDGSSPNNLVTYSIEGGNTNNAFMIDSTSGNIALAKQLVGYDVIPHYELTVTGTDGAVDPSPLTGTTTVLIKILDIETFSSWSQPPVNSGIDSGTASVKVEENSIAGTLTDIKLQVVGGNGNITYRMKSVQKYFTLGGPDGNVVIVQKPVDFELHPVITILIEAEDSSSTPKTGRVNMTILIEDINDNAPNFETSQYRVAVSDTSAIGHTIATVKAIDRDGTSPNNDVTYKFSDDIPPDAFTLDPISGVISLAKKLTQLTESPKTAYMISVIAYDGGLNPGPLSGTTTVTITVNKDASTLSSSSVSTTSVSTTILNTPIPGGTTILAPCLLTFLSHISLLIVY